MKKILTFILFIRVVGGLGGITLGGSNEIKFTWEIYDLATPLIVEATAAERFDAQTDQAKALKSKGSIDKQTLGEIRELLKARLEEYKDSIGDVTP